MTSPSIYCDRCGAANRSQATFCVACGRPLSAPPGTQTGLLTPGSLLKQRYRLLRQVGQGGFGAVYAAEDLPLGSRLVALKEMSQSGLAPKELQEATEAFQREAQLLARLKHPSLPAIYDYFGEAGRWYRVMEFITGETLEERLNKSPGRQLPVKETLQIGLQLCEVLEYLHSNHPPVIFRDLKPANVMVTARGMLYLIDFGIARLFKPGQSKDTMAFGTPGYSAPEQYGKMQTTTQSDIYSLGATLHQMLSGADPSTMPFRFAPLALANPAGLESLILHMVEQDPGKRPATMGLIKQQLNQMAEGQSTGQVGFNPAASLSGTTPRALLEASLLKLGYKLTTPPPVNSPMPPPAPASQPPAGTPMKAYVCPVCLQQHQIILAPGYTSTTCVKKNKVCLLLCAKTRVKRSHRTSSSPDIYLYQIRVILPDKSEQMVDFASRDGHFELRAGDEVIIAYYQGQPRVVLNTAIHRYMVAP